MKEIIINFTPTGIIPKKEDNPYVPIYPCEIIRDVKSAYELGIPMVHLHARNFDDQTSTHKKEVYGEIIAGIRKFAPELVICVSTSGRALNTFEVRSEVLDLEGNLRPDMASLTLSSLNFNKNASVNEPSIIISLARKMKEMEIKPELEIFDLVMINYFHYMIKKKMIDPPYYANLIFGNIACAQADLLHIGCMIKDIPDETVFSLGAVGNAQFKINSLAIAMGWGVRVGLEDNCWYDTDRTKLATNLEMIKRIHNIASANEKKIMAPSLLRKILRLRIKTY